MKKPKYNIPLAEVLHEADLASARSSKRTPAQRKKLREQVEKEIFGK